MHEVSIAQALLRQVDEVVSRHRLTTVSAVGICVGSLSGVVPEALAFAFQVLRDGPTAGAALQVRATDGADLRLEWIEGE
ncbi:MAG: hydrogenase maturation nickel metallochaperone HypA [Armatimonadota bacterium]|nr:hydrogenase maturation nickel metallochaperone HypA [Armatimonadota bacterium]MDR7519061.1 hydrogenase maturation nickel metallochaperone HypA [Armatimonadota bacterium]